ncbi:hypothetical protein Sjap_011146 [Stephania japonica]|uniref:Uncharacterized protein n=1 Tax=Stephania japonica TaxID=461633 RepID=A0AAP0P590_9MAGN
MRAEQNLPQKYFSSLEKSYAISNQVVLSGTIESLLAQLKSSGVHRDISHGIGLKVRPEQDDLLQSKHLIPLITTQYSVLDTHFGTYTRLIALPDFNVHTCDEASQKSYECVIAWIQDRRKQRTGYRQLLLRTARRPPLAYWSTKIDRSNSTWTTLLDSCNRYGKLIAMFMQYATDRLQSKLKMHLWPSSRIRDSFNKDYLKNLDWNLIGIKSDRNKESCHKFLDEENHSKINGLIRRLLARDNQRADQETENEGTLETKRKRVIEEVENEGILLHRWIGCLSDTEEANGLVQQTDWCVGPNWPVIFRVVGPTTHHMASLGIWGQGDVDATRSRIASFVNMLFDPRGCDVDSLYTNSAFLECAIHVMAEVRWMPHGSRIAPFVKALFDPCAYDVESLYTNSTFSKGAILVDTRNVYITNCAFSKGAIHDIHLYSIENIFSAAADLWVEGGIG